MRFGTQRISIKQQIKICFDRRRRCNLASSCPCRRIQLFLRVALISTHSESRVTSQYPPPHTALVPDLHFSPAPGKPTYMYTVPFYILATAMHPCMQKVFLTVHCQKNTPEIYISLDVSARTYTLKFSLSTGRKKSP